MESCGSMWSSTVLLQWFVVVQENWGAGVFGRWGEERSRLCVNGVAVGVVGNKIRGATSGGFLGVGVPCGVVSIVCTV